MRRFKNFGIKGWWLLIFLNLYLFTCTCTKETDKTIKVDGFVLYEENSVPANNIPVRIYKKISRGMFQGNDYILSTEVHTNDKGYFVMDATFNDYEDWFRICAFEPNGDTLIMYCSPCKQCGDLTYDDAKRNSNVTMTFYINK